MINQTNIILLTLRFTNHSKFRGYQHIVHYLKLEIKCFNNKIQEASQSLAAYDYNLQHANQQQFTLL